jgi:hypothetical protein
VLPRARSAKCGRRRVIAVAVLEVVSRQERVPRARLDQASHIVVVPFTNPVERILYFCDPLKNCSRVSISYYETEAEFPTAAALIPLARALGVTTDELLGVKPAKLDHGNPQHRRLWKRFQRMRHCRSGISARSFA